jgi:glutathione-regulated potassium-efflux system ancillary protein KefC
MRFRQHNLALFEKQHPHYRDQAKLISVIKEARNQLETQMAQEREDKAQRSAKTWDN